MIRTSVIVLSLLSFTSASACDWNTDPEGCLMKGSAEGASNRAAKAELQRNIDRIYDEGRRDFENNQRHYDAQKLNGTLELNSIYRPY